VKQKRAVPPQSKGAALDCGDMSPLFLRGQQGEEGKSKASGVCKT